MASQYLHATVSGYERNWFMSYDLGDHVNSKRPITIAGQITRQQHKLALCMIANVFADFTTAGGNDSWVNFRQKFAKYKTEGKVEEGLRMHGFVLERIVPDSAGTPVLQFRVRNRDQLYRLKGKVDDASLASLLTDYMIPPEEKQSSDVITFRLDHRQFNEVEKKIGETERQSMKMYQDYTAMRRVDNGRDILGSEHADDDRENDVWRQFRNKVMNTGMDANRQRCVLQNVQNFQ